MGCQCIMQNRENSNTIYAGFFVRLAAYLIDMILLGVILIFIRIPVWIITLVNPDNILMKPVLFKFTTWSIILYLITVFYFVILTYVSGSTVGKKLMNLKVISNTDEKLSLFNVLYRETIGKYLSSLLCIGYILIGLDTEKKGLHDILCDTRVIYVCKYRILNSRVPAPNVGNVNLNQTPGMHNGGAVYHPNYQDGGSNVSESDSLRSVNSLTQNNEVETGYKSVELNKGENVNLISNMESESITDVSVDEPIQMDTEPYENNYTASNENRLNKDYYRNNMDSNSESKDTQNTEFSEPQESKHDV